MSLYNTLQRSVIWLTGALIVAPMPSPVFAASTDLPRVVLPLGILVPTEGEQKPLGDEIQEGVRQALSEWAKRTGFPREAAAISVIPTELPWGTQTPRLINAIFDNRIAVLLGAPDRASAHLAGQVVARLKGKVLLLTLSEDPAMTQIGVPWILRAGTDTFTREGYRGSVRLAAHDAAMAVLEAAVSAGPDPERLRDRLLGHTFRGLTGAFTFDAAGKRTPVE